MAFWKQPLYSLCKFTTAAEVFVSLIAVRNSSKSFRECFHQSLETYFDKLTTVMYLSGQAMLPTLNPAARNTRDAIDTLLVRKIHVPNSRSLGVGDVVAFDRPFMHGDGSCVLVRRVCAMEGEILESDSPMESMIVPPGHCWVVADNPDMEPPDVEDSRYFGPLPLENIRGRVIYNGYSRNDHGPVINSKRSIVSDGPVIDAEVDVAELFPQDTKTT